MANENRVQFINKQPLWCLKENVSYTGWVIGNLGEPKITDPNITKLFSTNNA